MQDFDRKKIGIVLIAIALISGVVLMLLGGGNNDTNRSEEEKIVNTVALVADKSISLGEIIKPYELSSKVIEDGGEIYLTEEHLNSMGNYALKAVGEIEKGEPITQINSEMIKVDRTVDDLFLIDLDKTEYSDSKIEEMESRGYVDIYALVNKDYEVTENSVGDTTTLSIKTIATKKKIYDISYGKVDEKYNTIFIKLNDSEAGKYLLLENVARIKVIPSTKSGRRIDMDYLDLFPKEIEVREMRADESSN